MKEFTTFALALVSLAGVACSSKSEQADAANADTATPVATGTTSDTSAAHDMASMDGMAQMTGDADRDFLRMMSDHHTSMLLMTDRALSKGTTVKDEAARIAKEQSGEIEKMTALLKSAYSDSYGPKAMASARTMAGEFDPFSGVAFDKAFFEHTIMHHQAAIKMIDEYLPKAKNAEVKAMAEKMKAAQLKEIKEFEGKLSAL